MASSGRTVDGSVNSVSHTDLSQQVTPDVVVFVIVTEQGWGTGLRLCVIHASRLLMKEGSNSAVDFFGNKRGPRTEGLLYVRSQFIFLINFNEVNYFRKYFHINSTL